MAEGDTARAAATREVEVALRDVEKYLKELSISTKSHVFSLGIAIQINSAAPRSGAYLLSTSMAQHFQAPRLAKRPFKKLATTLILL